MTDPLNDALTSVSPVFTPPSLLVDWQEMPSEASTPGENLYDLSDVLSGKFTVSQSFDDALPDPVTMSTSNDASGTLSATLLSREGQVLAGTTTLGLAANQSPVSATFVDLALTGISWQPGDYIVVAAMVGVPPNTLITEARDQYIGQNWDKLADVIDGSYRLLVFGRHGYTGMPSPRIYMETAATLPVWSTAVFRAWTPNNDVIRWRVRNLVTGTAASSTTTHALPGIASAKGYSLAFFGANASITWTYTGTPGATIVQNATTGTSLAVAQSPMHPSQAIDTPSFTSSVATSTACYVGFSLEPYERPRMTPTQFWSPFNPDSPVQGFDRDTADVQFKFNTLTTTGPMGTTIYAGLMNDITLSRDQTVELTGVSKTRIALNKSLNLPMIFGRREGGSIDFLVAWLLARGNQFFGPAPSYMSRYWVPGYGSVHAGQDATSGYNYAMYWDTTGGPYGVMYPQAVPGPFLTGMFGCQTHNYTQEVVFDAINLYSATDIVPPLTIENHPSTDYLQDQLSITNAAGRISFWLRGDATDSTAVNVNAGNNYAWQYYHEAKTSGGTVLARVWAWISSSDYKLSIQMGNDASGYNTFVWPSSHSLPQDGQWHFYSIYWSWLDHEAGAMMDGVTSFTSAYTCTFGGWYNTDAALYAAGGKIGNTVRSHVPISDLQIEAGYDTYNNFFADQWPTMPPPSYTAHGRATNSALESVNGEQPVNAWDTLADLARNVMAWYRSNETDNFEFFPPTYFGENAHQITAEVVDTQVNAQDLAVTYDPSKSRNVVTVNFTDTRVGTFPTPALQLTTAYPIPRGVSLQTFTLGTLIAEIHGASDPSASWWTLTNLTSSQINSGVPPTGVHYMTVNAKSDGSGSIWGASNVTARIVSFTASTVTLQFTNKTSGVAYLVNNYSGNTQVPYLGILGYTVTTADGYITERDSGSIGVRRERALDVKMNWIQDRTTAQRFASQLVTALARPRAEVVVEVVGDPRRTPGELVTIADSQQTQAAGNWRVLAVNHSGDNAQYVQTLSLAASLPVAVWDQTNWDESIWGE